MIVYCRDEINNRSFVGYNIYNRANDEREKSFVLTELSRAATRRRIVALGRFVDNCLLSLIYRENNGKVVFSSRHDSRIFSPPCREISSIDMFVIGPPTRHREDPRSRNSHRRPRSCDPVGNVRGQPSRGRVNDGSR